jgi:hypothetical protein
MENAIFSFLCHLKECYSYCYYCSYQGSSFEDLECNCPGITESDHEDEE